MRGAARRSPTENVCDGYDAGALEAAAAAAGDAAGMGPTALRALCGDDAELRRRAIAAGAKPAVFAEDSAS